jgi:hypothetical protein
MAICQERIVTETGYKTTEGKVTILYNYYIKHVTNLLYLLFLDLPSM